MPASGLMRGTRRKDRLQPMCLCCALSPPPPAASVQPSHRDPPEWAGAFSPTVVVGGTLSNPTVRLMSPVSYCGLLAKTRLLKRNRTGTSQRDRVGAGWAGPRREAEFAPCRHRRGSPGKQRTTVDALARGPATQCAMSDGEENPTEASLPICT